MSGEILTDEELIRVLDARGFINARSFVETCDSDEKAEMTRFIAEGKEAMSDVSEDEARGQEAGECPIVGHDRNHCAGCCERQVGEHESALTALVRHLRGQLSRALRDLEAAPREHRPSEEKLAQMRDAICISDAVSAPVAEPVRPTATASVTCTAADFPVGTKVLVPTSLGTPSGTRLGKVVEVSVRIHVKRADGTVGHFTVDQLEHAHHCWEPDCEACVEIERITSNGEQRKATDSDLRNGSRLMGIALPTNEPPTAIDLTGYHDGWNDAVEQCAELVEDRADYAEPASKVAAKMRDLRNGQRRESTKPDAYSEGLLRVAVAARETLADALKMNGPRACRTAVALSEALQALDTAPCAGAARALKRGDRVSHPSVFGFGRVSGRHGDTSPLVLVRWDSGITSSEARRELRSEPEHLTPFSPPLLPENALDPAPRGPKTTFKAGDALSVGDVVHRAEGPPATVVSVSFVFFRSRVTFDDGSVADLTPDDVVEVEVPAAHGAGAGAGAGGST